MNLVGFIYKTVSVVEYIITSSLFPTASLFTSHTRSVRKIPEYIVYNFFSLTLTLFSLVAFKVLPSTLYAPLPSFLQCSEAFLESCFRNAAQMR